jgi:prepilin-type N-terminal cleavage/methylation domain-containing protein/prepilin-type processing-associated H-X9-DG protein
MFKRGNLDFRARAFTLVELMVCIMVICVLFALLLPAVQSAREAARRLQCAGNLKQIGIAINNYHESVGALPWGSGPWGWNDWSTHTLLLPFIDQVLAYNALNFSNGFLPDPNRPVPANVSVTRTTFSVFLCPSDLDRLLSADGHVNYSGNAGSAPNSFYGGGKNNFGSTGPYSGVFIFPGAGNAQPPTTLRFANITDGLSNTAAFSERVKGIGVNNQDRLDSLSPSSTIVELAMQKVDATPDSYRALCMGTGSGANTPMFNIESVGSRWYCGYAADTRYNHIMCPNSWSCAANLVGDPGAYTASSRHPGLVNVLLCDGAVRAVTNSVSVNVWSALGTRANGEVFAQTEY